MPRIPQPTTKKQRNTKKPKFATIDEKSKTRLEIGENTFEENDIEIMPPEEPNDEEKPKFKELSNAWANVSSACNAILVKS